MPAPVKSAIVKLPIGTPNPEIFSGFDGVQII